MEWGAPGYLWLLLAGAPLSLLALRSARRARLLRQELTGGRQKKVADLLTWGVAAAAMMLLVAALAGPRFGEESHERLAQGGDILFLLDTSRSMLTRDLGQSRLDAAKEAVRKAMVGLKGERVGLVAFAGSAFLVCPLTTDYALFDQVLKEAGEETLPLPGTSLAAALKEARRALQGEGDGPRVVVLLSDGEDHEGEYVAAARALNAAGVKLYAVAAGTLPGGPIPLPGGGVQKDRDGSFVLSRLRPETLREAAQSGGGEMVDIVALPARLATLPLQKSAAKPASSRQAQRERFQVPLSLALALLCAEPLLLFRGRP
ncbi:VWA domain-containing protein [Citrifermentans bremense]|uniref:VWA domain-containing protein n=1 Tax=Citrifermentans bremense TaxID=60035 RepID=UPI00040CCDFF|nr:VWA domain-containing protein [Citrifermentans bremense]